MNNEDFAAQAELERVRAFEAKHRATECRRCKAKGVTLTKGKGLCFKCESTRLATMVDTNAPAYTFEQPQAGEDAHETNARIARNHALLKARETHVNHPQTDAEKLVGENGPKAKGQEFARLQHAENLRFALAAALKSLPGSADRSILNQNARDAYERLHADCLKLANDYTRFTGRQVLIPGLRPDSMKGTDIVIGAAPVAKTVDPFEIDEPKPSPKIKVGKFAAGYGKT